jgi:hypothetical protein
VQNVHGTLPRHEAPPWPAANVSSRLPSSRYEAFRFL